jgi:hypothetical protein
VFESGANDGYRCNVLLTLHRGEPIYGLACNLGRDHVSTLELPVAHIIPATFKLGDDPAAAAVDREPPIACPVRDKDAWGAYSPGRRIKPGENASTWVSRSPFMIPNESA